MKGVKAARFITKCPHCQAKANIRDSEQQSDLVRKIKFQCTDPDCGHTFISLLSVCKTLSPSAKPNPKVNIPLSEKAQASA